MKQISIIGIGNQARSWAQNLSDSNFSVTMGIRSMHETAKSFQRDNPKVAILEINSNWLVEQNCIALLIPDDQHEAFLKYHCSSLKRGTSIIYAHGFSEVACNLSQKFPQFNHLLLAPKSIATELRMNYLTKKNLAAVYAIKSTSKEDVDKLKTYLTTLAIGLGITWGPFEVSFEQECKADLFSEQTLLCNFVPELLGQSFNKLIEKKIPWELAFCEIFLELKLIINALEAVGPKEFYNLISPNALTGSHHYMEKWKDRMNLNELLEQCWEQLENGQMINHLISTDYKSDKDKILKKWDNHPLTRAFNSYSKTKGLP